jgi:hypothetical protein
MQLKHEYMHQFLKIDVSKKHFQIHLIIIYDQIKDVNFEFKNMYSKI